MSQYPFGGETMIKLKIIEKDGALKAEFRGNTIEAEFCDEFTEGDRITLSLEGGDFVAVKLDETSRIYRRALANGDILYAVFNMTRETVSETIEIGENSAVRDVWAQENLPASSNLTLEMQPHGAYLLRVTPR